MPAKKPAITARLCETKPAQRIKVYDAKCPGFYVSVTPAGIATFYFKYWDRALDKQVPVRIGDYDPAHLTVEQARATAYDLKGRVGRGEDVAQSARFAKAQRAKLSGKKVGEIIDEYVAWIKEPVEKKDGEKRPRTESWGNVAAYLERFVRPRLGDMVASEVTNDHVAALQSDIVAGEVNPKYKPSVSNARNARAALSGMFNWAAEAGKHKYVTASPCVNLPELDKEHERDRVLSAAEIKVLWWGLDRPDLPCSRSIALALKFELVTMLRTKEFLSGKVSEIVGFGGDQALFQIPLRRVKKRRIIVHPLSDLARDIIAESVKSDQQEYIFPGRIDGEPLDDKALGHAVRGFKDKKGRVVRLGICEFLGMAHWTPHDLRRTAATLAGDLGFSDAIIGKCLDHSNGESEDAAPTVTGIYVRSKRDKEKREVLDAVAKALREIVGTKPPAAVRLKLELVA